MASERQANTARDLFSSDLVKQGAHAIGVEPGKDHGHPGFVVVAYVPPTHAAKFPTKLALPTEHGGGDVSLVMQSAQPFTPQ